MRECSHALVAVSTRSTDFFTDQATEVQLSQEELGYLCGVSRQRVNQALQVLEKAGLIKVEYGRIRILELDGLRNFA